MFTFENIKVLISGCHDKIGNEFKIGSTITLIKAEKNILIDTGGFGKKKEIIEILKREKLSPKQIDIIFLTHLHLDHIANISLFTSAKIYCKLQKSPYPGQVHNPKIGTIERIELNEGTEIIPNVSILELPGHTNDSLGLLIKTDKGNIVIAGDAIASEKFASLECEPEAILVADLIAYDESRKKLLQVADFIIPGHGMMFKVKK